jgi:hypothetical protein
MSNEEVPGPGGCGFDREEVSSKNYVQGKFFLLDLDVQCVRGQDRRRFLAVVVAIYRAEDIGS